MEIERATVMHNVLCAGCVQEEEADGCGCALRGRRERRPAGGAACGDCEKICCRNQQSEGGSSERRRKARQGDRGAAPRKVLLPPFLVAYVLCEPQNVT